MSISALLSKFSRPAEPPKFQAAHPIRTVAGEWPAIPLPTCKNLENTPEHTVRFGVDAPVEDVLQAFRRYGIAVIDGGLTKSEIDDANRLLTDLNSESAVITFDGGSKVARIRQHHLAGAISASNGFRAVADHRLVKAANTDFYNSTDWNLIAIYALDYKDFRQDNVAFHIDPTAVPKALVYLSDVESAKDGAFEFDLGSHREGFFRMTCHYYEANKRAHEIPNDEIRIPTRVLGKAGTIILFNTVGIHRAGDVANGHIRKSLTYFFSIKDANDNDLSVPPFEYSVLHQSLERKY